MDNQNTNIDPRAGFFSKSYLKHIAAFLGLIVLVGGSYFVWDGYFSPEAKYEREIEKGIAELPGKLEAYKANMEADTYGGKTPEETLQMFIDALKKGDIELASKYFALDEDTAEPDLMRAENLKKIKSDGRVSELIGLLSQAESAGSPMEGYYGFQILDKNGELIADVDMRFNQYSNVWKIESL
jgi:hypothetical protein